MPQESWSITSDNEHNAFTDLLFWRDYYWLVYVSSPSHFKNSKSCLVLMRSGSSFGDSTPNKSWDSPFDWQEIRRFDGAVEDIRDPKLGIINDRLYVFALLNKRFDPEPYKTIVAHSDDGVAWTGFEDVTPAGWLLGRPVTTDGICWYAPAHRIDTGTAVLLRSTDGVNWSICSTIFEGKLERADETAIHFLKNGSLVAVTRLEAGSSLFGSEQAATLISISVPPFTHWNEVTRSRLTRLDSPVLFSLALRGKQDNRSDEHLYAVGRRQTRVRAPFEKQGSAFGRKRTALFRVNLPLMNHDLLGNLTSDKAAGLVHLVDLPSSGDTAYAGVVVRDKKVIISYYTNDPQTDYPWVFGMLCPTRIQIAVFDVENLMKLEDEK